MESKERKTVTICGNEYLRAEIEIDYFGKSKYFYYARRLDDSLMSIIFINSVDDEKPAKYEKLFE